ncbi:hypothetical protein Droror1_Dr00000807, partial [Drosera rotundifolia]
MTSLSPQPGLGLLDVFRDRAFVILAEDLTQSCNFLRRSAGVYSYLASAILPPFLPKLPADKPLEVFATTCTAWSLICLAEAQAIDFLDKLLLYDHEDRLTAKEAM